MSQVFSKTSRNQRTLRYQKYWSYNSTETYNVKTRCKTINAEFIPTCASSQLSFIQFRPMHPRSGDFCLWHSCQKVIIKRPWSLYTSVDARFEGCVLNVDYLEKRCHSFILKKYCRKRRLAHSLISFSGL